MPMQKGQRYLCHECEREWDGQEDWGEELKPSLPIPPGYGLCPGCQAEEARINNDRTFRGSAREMVEAVRGTPQYGGTVTARFDPAAGFYIWRENWPIPPGHADQELTRTPADRAGAI
jgi:hypothetical protein